MTETMDRELQELSKELGFDNTKEMLIKAQDVRKYHLDCTVWNKHGYKSVYSFLRAYNRPTSRAAKKHYIARCVVGIMLEGRIIFNRNDVKTFILSHINQKEG